MDKTPDSILIVGSGLFGLSTAWALTKRPRFDKTTITVLDNARGQFPPEDAASVDKSRIVRADYADADYAALGAEAQAEWRKQADGEVGGEGRYSENGIVVMANKSAVRYGKKVGMDYARASWENVSNIARKSGQPDKVFAIEGQEALKAYVGSGGNPGDWGYVNKLSGWTDNGASMKWMYEQVKKTGRINFVDAEAQELVTEGTQVTGARLKDGRVLKADVTFVAAGAWTGSLIDLRGRAEATGHVLGYIDISKEEQELLGNNPTVINFTSGMFVIPPRDGVLKVAQHAYGYLNPRTVTGALPPSPTHERKPIVTSLPRTKRDNGFESIPETAARGLRQGLKDLLPARGFESRPWSKTKMCWYSDTRDADWLVDWHPGWDGLFIATGDSGHGFKFLPVIGDKLVDVLEGKGGKLGDKWRWKDLEDDGAGRETNGKFKGLITDDGSRGGAPGLVLEDELRKSGSARIGPKL